MSTPNAQWVSYLANKENHQTIVGVNLGLAELKTAFRYPFAGKITLYANIENIREDGLPNQEELDRLQAFEDTLIEMAERSNASIFCGWLTGNGKRELFFYAGNGKQFSKKIEPVLKKQTTIQAEMIVEKDEKWTKFFEELYPSAEELAEIQQRILLEEESDEEDVD